MGMAVKRETRVSLRAAALLGIRRVHGRRGCLGSSGWAGWKRNTLRSPGSLRPCPRNGASWRAGVGRVRSLAFLSILQWSSPLVPDVQAIEISLCQNGFSTAC